MNILRHLYLSTALRAPDDPAAPEPEVVVEPVAEVVAEPAAEVVPEPAPEPLPEAAKPEPHGNAGKTPWYMKEIAQTREEKRQAKAEADEQRQRNADLQAIIERMQADPAAAPPAKAAERAAPPATEFQAAVKAQAARDRFIEDTVGVRNAGMAAYTDFAQSLDILAAVGATNNDDFVADLLAVDKAGAHALIDKLAKDPEKAASLVGMESRRRIAELTRMADAPKTEVKLAAEVPKPAAISKAPAPAPRLAPLASAPEVDPTTPEGNAKMDAEAWNKWYASKYLKRA